MGPDGRDKVFVGWRNRHRRGDEAQPDELGTRVDQSEYGNRGNIVSDDTESCEGRKVAVQLRAGTIIILLFVVPIAQLECVEIRDFG